MSSCCVVALSWGLSVAKPAGSVHSSLGLSPDKRLHSSPSPKQQEEVTGHKEGVHIVPPAAGLLIMTRRHCSLPKSPSQLLSPSLHTVAP